MPDARTCDMLMFKDQFIRFAQEEGYPVPKSAYLSLTDLPRGVKAAGFELPVIVKPANKSGAWERKLTNKAYIIRREEDWAAMAAADGVVESVLVQEYIEGGDDSVYFCLYFDAPGMSEPIVFTGRKLLQWPPSRGSTAVCEPVDAPDLERLTRRLFQSLGVHGFCSLEVKYRRDGTFRIIEPTVGRPDLQSYVATLNGVNMPLAAYLALTGRPTEAQACVQKSPRDVVWIYESSLLNLIRQRAIPRSMLYHLARRRRGYVLASLSDPGVFGSFVQDQCRLLGRKLLRRRGVVRGAV
jgi:predicted ATP-grasp superfamily ATP-dependent carboligase